MGNQLGPHSLDMDALMGNDLERLVQVVAGALHQEEPGPNPIVPAGAKEAGGNQNQDLKSNRVQEPPQKNSERMKQEGACISLKTSRRPVDQAVFIYERWWSLHSASFTN